MKAGGSRPRKISVPVEYKFSPTYGDLVNHHLKRKLKNVSEENYLIPVHNHYEAEPWDLIKKYNELSDGESNDDTCFFFCTNRGSKRIQRSTPKGRWHETSKTKTIKGSDGVAYVMRYFTFYNGHKLKKRDITPWRMREFTDPSKEELALCKIFKGVDSKKKTKDGRGSLMPGPTTSMQISPAGSQTPDETYADMARECPTPTSTNLTNNSLFYPKWQPMPFDEFQVQTSSADPNPINYGVISFHQQNPTHINSEEGYPPSQNTITSQSLGSYNSAQYNQLSCPNLMNDSLISSPHQQPMHIAKGYTFAQNAFLDRSLDFINQYNTSDMDEYNKVSLDTHNPNTSDATHYKHRHRVEGGISLEELQQPPTKKSRISTTEYQNSLQETHMDMERNFSSMNNSSFNTSMSFLQWDNMLTGLRSEEVNWEEVCSLVNPPPTQPWNLDLSNYMVFSPQRQLQVPMEGSVPDSHNTWQEIDIEVLLASPSNCISLDDMLTTNGTNIEGHSNESTDSLSPSNRCTSDKAFPGQVFFPLQQNLLLNPATLSYHTTPQ